MKITYTQIKSFLNKCVFNPKLPGPLKIISDIGNPSYYETRAIEFVKEAKFIDDNVNEANLLHYDDCIIKAIQLLILARETHYQELNKSITKDKN